MILQPDREDDSVHFGDVALPSLPNWVTQLMDTQERQTANSDLVVVAQVETETDSDLVVANGDLITFTFVLSNPSTEAITVTNIRIMDPLPETGLDDVGCTPQQICRTDFITTAFNEPFFGSRIVLTTTLSVSWTISDLAPGTSTGISFSGRVSCQPDGAVIKNRVFYAYQVGGSDRSGNSEQTQTSVVIPQENKGQVNLSGGPTWCSIEPGGIYDLDWGDFDGDGDLDLATASLRFGAVVYRNDIGQLTRIWAKDHSSFGIRWANFDDDNELELVIVGDGKRNYIYTDLNSPPDILMSTYEFLRVETGDFDGDTHIDWIASTNAISPQCAVHFFKNDGSGHFSNTSKCFSKDSTPSIAPGDYDGDGKLDLALLQFHAGSVGVLVNDGTGLTTTNFITLEANLATSSIPFDLAWGDYDNDGDLDIAGAYTPFGAGTPEIRVYSNDAPAGFVACPNKISVSPAVAGPYAVDWGDFDGDGVLELIVDDSPPVIYRRASGCAFSPLLSLPASSSNSIIWRIRGVDQDNDGDLDLSISDLKGPSLLYTTLAPFLNTRMSVVASLRASSVAWGDADDDDDLDLLLGAGPDFGSHLLSNISGTFTTAQQLVFNGFGPRSVAFGDVDGDDRLDIAFGTGGQDEVYLAGNSDTPDWVSLVSRPNRSVAWGDAWLDDADGRLDLLVGGEGPTVLYLNQDGQLAPSPSWVSEETNDTRSVAWGDFNNDGYMDFAVGNSGPLNQPGQPNQIYCNNKDLTFSRVWSSSSFSHTWSVAWGDYDRDGDLDLAVGNYDGRNFIYKNRICDTQDCKSQRFLNLTCEASVGYFDTEPVWVSEEVSQTTSLAWGDWDNDGDPDLAVGNYDEPDQVYANQSTLELLQLRWFWTSAENYRTTQVAWGDRDGDGDLDLAVSQDGAGGVGVYENFYVSPIHLQDQSKNKGQLLDTPPYLVIEQPGAASAGHFLSSAELLSDPTSPTIAIDFTLFDPDVTQAMIASGRIKDPIIRAAFEYSLDGGGTWHTATPSGTVSASSVLTPSSQGRSYTFLWNARKDQAIGDDTRFRVTVFSQKRSGPVQRAATSAISPSFRTRALECYWPQDPSITVTADKFEPNKPIRFSGGVAAGSGVLKFAWDFGDRSPIAYGQTLEHRYVLTATYNVRLTVTGELCPITRAAMTSTMVTVGSEGPIQWLFFPVIGRSNVSSGAAAAVRLDPLSSAWARKLGAEYSGNSRLVIQERR
jgi:uncharacterized repeat protein (TIGR01451 family)